MLKISILKKLPFVIAVALSVGYAGGFYTANKFNAARKVAAYETQIKEIGKALDAGRDAVDDTRANGLRDDWYRD